MLERQSDEPKRVFDALVYYCELEPPRLFKHVAEKFDVTTKAVCVWKDKYNWEERIEAYDRYIEDEEKKRRVKFIDESSFRYLEELNALIALLALPAKILAKRIKDEGLGFLEDMDKDELMRLAGEHADKIAKLMKTQRDISATTKEGRELLESETSGNKIVINVGYAPPREEKKIEKEEAVEIEYERESDSD